MATEDRTFLENLYTKTGGGNPAELSNIEITELLKVLDEEKKHHLANKTHKSIKQEIRDILKGIVGAGDIYKKLRGEYRYVDEIHELDKGKYVRWINDTGDGALTNGGIVCDLTTGNDGILVQCRSVSGGAHQRFFKYNFNNNITFQKLTPAEKIILAVKDYVSGGA